MVYFSCALGRLREGIVNGVSVNHESYLIEG